MKSKCFINFGILDLYQINHLQIAHFFIRFFKQNISLLFGNWLCKKVLIWEIDGVMFDKRVGENSQLDMNESWMKAQRHFENSQEDLTYW